jgi:RNA polymerase sigma-70 factor, ECF subfamily
MDEGDADEALMLQTALGSHRAFRILMARHIGSTIRIAETVLGDTAESDDVAQEAFMRVWRRASSFDPSVARFTTWLYRIVVNLAIDRARRPRGDPIENAEHVATDEPGALASIIAKEDASTVGQCIAQLPERQRAALALFHFEGLSGRDAAQVMEMTEKAFESLLIRARAALKQRVLGRTHVRGGDDDPR